MHTYTLTYKGVHTTFQGPKVTYTAQCNGVKGFPSRYANGLCSSNNSRQSSCPSKVKKKIRETIM